MGRRATIVRGRSAAILLYEGEHLERSTAMPARVQATLTGHGGVQTLDGALHLARKAMFMSLMTPDRLERFRALVDEGWARRFEQWQPDRDVVLFDEAREVMFRAACEWTGVPLPATGVPTRSATMTSMVDGFAAVGPRHLRARLARRSAERWARRLIADVRAGALVPEDGDALAVVAGYREAGALLDGRTAAVELLNVLRPITAIAWWAVHCAHALHMHPSWREVLADGDEDHLEAFAQEVRRHYPFTPVVGARARRDIAFEGHVLEERSFVILDVPGTHHDARLWPTPGAFRPERFLDGTPDPYTFLPHGGGDPRSGHRCAGDAISVEGMKATLAFLAGGVRYDVPSQDLGIPLGRIPTGPRSGFVIRGVRRRTPRAV
jgi:fatty-acid peroxygenase